MKENDIIGIVEWWRLRFWNKVAFIKTLVTENLLQCGCRYDVSCMPNFGLWLFHERD
jgi:hypothetical protein